MEVVIGSSLLRAEVFAAIDVQGREHLVIVVKASWSIPLPGQRPKPLEPPALVFSDEHYGEPGMSAVRYPSDMVRFKPACDLLFDACAHAPEGKPVTALGVQVQVGSWTKQLKVMGPRHWRRVAFEHVPSRPEPFLSMPLHLGMAFGGSNAYEDAAGEDAIEVYEPNPVGMGWVGSQRIAQAKGRPLPCVEAFDEPVIRPDGKVRPMALSAIAVHAPERQRYAGTYDEAWRHDVFPFLPEDFDERYHHSAPPDQRIAYPQGGEEVQLIHMLADQPHARFKLPALNALQMRVLRKDYSVEQPTVHADTLFFETEARRFSVVWRASVPIRRRIQEFNTVAVGPLDEQWWRARSLGLDESGCAGCGPTARVLP